MKGSRRDFTSLVARGYVVEDYSGPAVQSNKAEDSNAVDNRCETLCDQLVLDDRYDFIARKIACLDRSSRRKVGEHR